MASTVNPPAPVVVDDIEIVPDPVSPARRVPPRWAVLPLLPWSWFVVRGIHPIVDLVAIALPALILACIAVATLLSFFRDRRTWSLTALSLVLFFGVAVIGPWRPIDAPKPVADQSFRIASVNLGLYWFSDNDAGYYVEREQPDVLVGAELTESHDAEFSERFEFAETDIISLARQQANDEGLAPDGTSYRQNALPSIGVYSNFPMETLEDPIEEDFEGGLPGFRMRLETPSGPVILYALHIPRPTPGVGPYQLSPGDQSTLIDLIVAAIRRETDPVVVMGDLNVVDRSSGYRSFTAELDDGMRQSGWAVPTADRGLPWNLLFARIDHLLIDRTLCATDGASEDTRFADHRPLVATVGPCAEN